MSEWISAQLNDVVEDILDRRGVTPLKLGSSFKTSGYRVFSAKNIKQNRIDLTCDEARFIDKETYQKWMKTPLIEDDVILTSEAPLGEVAYYSKTDSLVLGQRLFGIRTKKDVMVGRFLFYLFQSPEYQHQLRTRMTGTTAEGIRQSELRLLSLTVPPISEQRAIAHILGTLDDKIELNRRMNETLEGIARALFRSWFIDFDPVRAKAEGRQPFGMDLETAALFPNQFEDSELGEIPKGWDICKLSDICTTQYGYTASAKKSPYGPKLLRVTDINKTDHILWDDVPNCTIPDEFLGKYKLAKGDIVVARMADPGKAAIIDDDTHAIFASYLVRLRTDSLAGNYYVYSFLKSPIYQQYAEEVKGGSVQANMNAKVIVGCPIVKPHSAIIDCYYKTIYQVREKITSNLAINSTLRSLRDSMLPKLISGDIRVDPSKFGFSPEREKVGEV